MTNFLKSQMTWRVRWSILHCNDDIFSPHRNVVAPSISHASLKSSTRSLMATALLTWQRPRNVIFANQRRLWPPRKRNLLRRPTMQLTVKTDPIYSTYGFKKLPYLRLIKFETLNFLGIWTNFFLFLSNTFNTNLTKFYDRNITL